MSPVFIENPRSFEIEKFLLARPEIRKLGLSLIDPRTGLEIYHRLVNLPIIGLTFAPTPNSQKPFGFLPETATDNTAEPCDEKDEDHRPQFVPQALLVLEVNPKDLPPNVKNAWVIQVEDKKNEPAFVEVAKILSANFNNMDIVVTSAYMTNDDPDTVNGVPSNPSLPGSAPFCPIIIRRTDPANVSPQPS